jgi:small subunit ribosomal protein S18
MSEQVNPTAEEEETEESAVTSSAPDEERPAQTRAESRPARPMRAESYDDDDEGDDDNDDNDDDDDEGEDEGDDGERYVEGPAEYVQRERSGRGRRIGSEVKAQDVDYKNIPLLSRFLDRRGRILSRRKTRVSARVQRRIVTAIKRARHLALLPYTADQTRIVRRRR